MPIVDSQVHIWAASTPERPWPARHAPHREPPLGPDELLRLMDRAGVDGAILVPPSWEGERNDLVLAAAARHPTRFAAMGRLDPGDPDLSARLAGWREQPGMLGLRFSLHRPGMAQALENGAMDAVWQGAERHGVPVMLLLPQARMPVIGTIAARYPGLRLVLDHLGVPSSVPVEQRFRDMDALLALAAYPNVAVKASALPCLSLMPYPHPDLAAPLRLTFAAFGARRMFWGSDLSRLPCSYRAAVDMLPHALPDLDAEDRAWVMGKGICEWLGWHRPHDAVTPAPGAFESGHAAA
ncbi:MULTISPECIES: amidohydrolase [unclassified Achromobacter]|uniref:amidohydrolase family protein n=1 Tax=unclassified Achromobacter TaxID=2626865 RepID=UPI000B51BBF0|nr:MULTISPECIES: amidohydrolase family protein [unclassified Achromobacter]OWT77089.1 metal-dependent hydrolase [Achromobacter sp. HZ28]OWT77970.1 metal-dependent hydrolase [Achromobacter sp. HZ34]